MKVQQVILLLCLSFAAVHSLDNGLANVPPLGWSTWNLFWCNTNCTALPELCVSEKNIKEIADAMVASGLHKLGYEYVNVDDCYLAKERDPATQKLIPDPVNFPSGMKNLGDYIHSKGLKYGMYNDVGTHTCGGYPGSKDHYALDIATFKEWGVDYLKMDGCYEQLPVYHYDYTELHEQIDSQSANIVYECSWPAYVMKPNQFDWAYLRSICNTWRTYGDDIRDNWGSVKSIIEYWAIEDIAKYSAPGSFHMADFLTTGQGGMTDDEYRTQFNLWSMWSSPIMLSTDLRNMTAATFDIISNAEVIQTVSQDPLVKQATRVRTINGVDVWVKELVQAHNYAVAFVNMNDTESLSATINFADILPNVQNQEFVVRDLWLHQDLSLAAQSFTSHTLAPHQSQLIKIELNLVAKNMRKEVA
ncbi:hypothetical protein ABPG72_003710 [Tetrahymena utriculariae]